MRKQSMLIGGIALALFATLLFIGYLAFHTIAILSPAGTIASQQKNLLLFATGLSLIVVIPVFILTFTIAWRYRAENKKSDYRPEWSGNVRLEAVWWGIPILIIFVLSVITWQSSHSLDPFKTLSSQTQPIKVQVVSLQWRWLFLYPDYGIATINDLYLPENTPINFELTSDAPMNSFWIPRLGSQIYTMAGMRTMLHLESTQRGSYEGYSANISGEGFSDMKFITQVDSSDNFTDWLSWVRQQPDVLTEEEYAAMAEPVRDANQYYFGSYSRGLFSHIIDSYMQNPQAVSNEFMTGRHIMEHN